MKKLARYILCVLCLIPMVLIVSGCDNPMKPKSQFWGTFVQNSQYTKHVFLDGPDGQVFNKPEASPGWSWQGYLEGSKQYVLHWSWTDGTEQRSYTFRINSVQDHDAHDIDGNKMDWHVELGDGGVSNFQARLTFVPHDSP